jgi:uncharacterized protein (TIGR01244 family)
MFTSAQRLSEDFAVAPQLSPADMAAVAAAGYKSIIINRPDHEAGPSQPTAAQMLQAASEAGLQARYQPVASGAITQVDVAHFAQLLYILPMPVLAYCRSGTRCAQLFYQATQA